MKNPAIMTLNSDQAGEALLNGAENGRAKRRQTLRAMLYPQRMENKIIKNWFVWNAFVSRRFYVRILVKELELKWTSKSNNMKNHQYSIMRPMK